MNNHYLAHIIRDIFPNRAFTVIYGNNQDLRLTLLSSEHSVGALQLHTERDAIKEIFEYRFWEPALTNPFISYGDVDLFISINYDPIIDSKHTLYMAIQIKRLLKQGGKALIINPGEWANRIKNVMRIDGISTKEIKRYSMIKDENVLIYENI